MTREEQWKAHYEATLRQRDRWMQHCDDLEAAIRYALVQIDSPSYRAQPGSNSALLDVAIDKLREALAPEKKEAPDA